MVDASRRKRKKFGLGTTENSDERRMAIIRLIMGEEHPKELTTRRLAKRFNVSFQQIHKDMPIIHSWIKEHYADECLMYIVPYYVKAIPALMREGNYKDARQIVKDWTDFMFNTGKLEKKAEKIEHSLTEIITIDDIQHGYEQLKGTHKNKERDTER